MNKARQAVDSYALRKIQRAGLGGSDLRVLAALLHKGPLPVNTIGPKVHLTPRFDQRCRRSPPPERTRESYRE
jgi:MarR family 2-MHQ and catechol resistance regulon transcriptional repressor